MQRRLYQLLETTGSATARLIDLFILVAIVVSTTAFTVSTVPSIRKAIGSTLELIQLVTVVIFSVEYVLRLIAAGGKSESRGTAREAFAYATSFFGLIDLLSILPFYLEAGGFVALRSLRLLRLFRLLKLSRYTKALQTFVDVLRKRSGQLGVFGFLASILLFLAATGIYYAEHDAQPAVFSSIPASLWWAIVTLTTVGYGDSYPVTALGQFYTSAILVLGIAILAVPTGVISAGLVEAIGANEKRPEHEAVCPTCGQLTTGDQEIV